MISVDCMNVLYIIFQSTFTRRFAYTGDVGLRSCVLQGDSISSCHGLPFQVTNGVTNMYLARSKGE